MSQDITTEKRILEAARKIFIDKGLDGARMQDIADEAGINKALLHYYFRSKEKLFDTIFTEVIQEFLPKIFSIINSDYTLFEKIKLFCSAYVQQEIDTPFVPMFIINEVNRDPQALLKRVLQSQKPPFEKIITQIKQEEKEGRIKPIEPFHLLLNTVSLCVFPFLARPLFQTITNMDNKQFTKLMQSRVEEISQLIIHSIKA